MKQTYSPFVRKYRSQAYRLAVRRGDVHVAFFRRTWREFSLWWWIRYWFAALTDGR
jgi:hypothetical protein